VAQVLISRNFALFAGFSECEQTIVAHALVASERRISIMGVSVSAFAKFIK
jgi:hypothetical protein